MSADGKATTDQQKLSGALEILKDVLVGKELEKVKGAVSSVDSRVSDELEVMKKDMTDAVARVARELTTRVDEVLEKLADAEKARDDALVEIRSQVDTALGGLDKKVADMKSENTKQRTKLRNDIESSLAASEETMRGELGSLGQALSVLQLELQQQEETTTRVSGLLSNMATVFSGGTQPAEDMPPGMTGEGGEENLDTALDRMFPDEHPEGDSSHN